ncbi:hypothetical protein H1P_140035 [Hyella patelloides LEGE 07179]|uniref:Uncharacterized protein n=1 Tax=Hyella patelloides LEGE 07179 TaxID=945734 RepID=A0A563VLF9_9CYAN|nr:hypothetical protein H1P_140035 [Hyella patelloides LEGE 07179]
MASQNTYELIVNYIITNVNASYTMTLFSYKFEPQSFVINYQYI